MVDRDERSVSYQIGFCKHFLSTIVISCVSDGNQKLLSLVFSLFIIMYMHVLICEDLLFA